MRRDEWDETGWMRLRGDESGLFVYFIEVRIESKGCADIFAWASFHG
jgi:hypothetical protein